MAIQVIIDLQAKPGGADKVRKFFLDKLPGTRGFKGNITVNTSVNRNDPEQFTLVEQWNSQEDFDAYVAWRGETGVLTELAAITEGQGSFKFYDYIGI